MKKWNPKNTELLIREFELSLSLSLSLSLLGFTKLKDNGKLRLRAWVKMSNYEQFPPNQIPARIWGFLYFYCLAKEKGFCTIFNRFRLKTKTTSKGGSRRSSEFRVHFRPAKVYGPKIKRSTIALQITFQFSVFHFLLL